MQTAGYSHGPFDPTPSSSRALPSADARRSVASGRQQEALADWQVALLLGGSAVGGLAAGLAALFGLSLLV